MELAGNSFNGLVVSAVFVAIFKDLLEVVPRREPDSQDDNYGPPGPGETADELQSEEGTESEVSSGLPEAMADIRWTAGA
eukprot:9198404-Lingulodinium_polyedra.AAC.2